MTYDELLPPWSIQPDEPSMAFNTFAKYRDLGPRRTVFAVAREHIMANEPEFEMMSKADQDKRVHSLASHYYSDSKQWEWVARARAYDAYMDAERVEAARIAQQNAVNEAQKNHIMLGRALTSLMGKGVKIAVQPTTDAQKKKIEKELEEMGVSSLIVNTRAAVAFERQVLGMDSRIEQEAAEQSQQQARTGPPLSLEEAKRIAKEAILELPPPPKPIDLPPPPDDTDEPEPDHEVSQPE